ncbi:hypothetical protein D3C73_543590 [compost metagenome]
MSSERPLDFRHINPISRDGAGSANGTIIRLFRAVSEASAISGINVIPMSWDTICSSVAIEVAPKLTRLLFPAALQTASA